jgi:hypothetical protein
MKIKRTLSSNQRKRTLHRNKIRLVNRRHTQFTLDQYHSEQVQSDNESELNRS